MPEANLISYSFKELAELLVRDRNLHEGFWGIYAKFGITGANTGPSAAEIKPTAIVPILELGLQRFDELNALCVNAAEVNPTTTVRRRPGARRATKGRIKK